MLHKSHRRLTLTAIALSAFGVLPAVGQTIDEDHKLLPSDGTNNENFGNSIAIDNGIVAVGVANDYDNNWSGSVYLFDASTGAQLFKLFPSNGSENGRFGFSTAIDNASVAVGSIGDNYNGRYSGSAYIFDASSGEQLFKLLPSDDGGFNDQFGFSIGIHSGIVAVGVPKDTDNGQDSGSAYLFDASTGAQIAKLFPSDGAAGDRFGNSIAISNGIVAVSSIFDGDNGYHSGSAYLFDASTGTQLLKLLPNDGAPYASFGYSVAIDNGIVAIGAPYRSNSDTETGSVYLFNASTGEQIAKLVASDGMMRNQFGRSVAIDNGVVAVGALGIFDDNGEYSGSAYLFDATTGEQIAKLLASDGAALDHLGISIGIDNGIIAAGSDGDDDNGNGSGSAYVFTAPDPCPANLTNDSILDFFDVSAFLAAFANQDPIADFTGDGIYDFFDVSAFLQAFAAGCP